MNLLLLNLLSDHFICNKGTMLEISRTNDTFEHSAATTILPQDIRDNSFYNSYVKEAKSALMERAHSREIH